MLAVQSEPKSLNGNIQSSLHRGLLLGILISIILLGILRSAIATRLDSLDIDEAYHIVAGVSYVRHGDYRLNPEHPPLVKLWVGAFLPHSAFHLPAFKPMADKVEERRFANETVYLQNDPDAVQHRARIAMFSLNGLLLLGLALAVWRLFHPVLAIGTISFLVIDPTVAAHMPMVLTDLPLALLASTAVLLSFYAFRTWKSHDLIIAGVVLGLAFGAKHSAPIILAGTGLLGTTMALRDKNGRDRMRHLAKVLAVMALAWIVLWSLYRFRFNESPAGFDLFNRSLAEKIADVNSSGLRSTVSYMSKFHVLPRAYLWGLADIIRAGVEGRVYSIYFWDRYYIRKTPFYFFAGLIFFKLPIGLIVLSVIGALFMSWDRIPADWKPGLVVMLGLALLLLAMLALGNSSYAGIRHALPIFPTVAILGAVAIFQAIAKRSPVVRISVMLAVMLALFSAIPVLRPWEYFNEFAGGSAYAYRHFNGEGIDSGQRIKELAAYYHKELEPKGIVPYVDYWFFYNDEELLKRGVRTQQMQWNEAPSADSSEVVSGTLLINANLLTPDPWFDYTSLRSSKPVERFGNLLVYRGQYPLPNQRAGRLTVRALLTIYSEKPDLAKAEQLLREAVALAPQVYFANLELGNLLAQRGDREQAIGAYRSAKTYAPVGEPIGALLARQIELVSHGDPKSVPPLRDPWLE